VLIREIRVSFTRLLTYRHKMCRKLLGGLPFLFSCIPHCFKSAAICDALGKWCYHRTFRLRIETLCGLCTLCVRIVFSNYLFVAFVYFVVSICR
jgi:hypothetical protein